MTKPTTQDQLTTGSKLWKQLEAAKRDGSGGIVPPGIAANSDYWTYRPVRKIKD